MWKYHLITLVEHTASPLFLLCPLSLPTVPSFSLTHYVLVAVNTGAQPPFIQHSQGPHPDCVCVISHMGKLHRGLARHLSVSTQLFVPVINSVPGNCKSMFQYLLPPLTARVLAFTARVMYSFLSRGRWRDITGGGLSCCFFGVSGVCVKSDPLLLHTPWTLGP